jgi:crotonobetainyl-CoA:carnitine CoA-transferase CaiB-like acyl-CoA transferase
MLLGDMGAEVIKVERPGVGDPARLMPGFFRSINRNKKSVTLNLKHPRAREIMGRLIKEADVFQEGFRPGVVRRLGLDYESLSRENPRLVYCSISGFGQSGPYRDLPGHDINYQALAGMLYCFKDSTGIPIQPSLAIADLSSGMFAALGIIAALMLRERTGKGQYIDVSMFDGLISLMSTHFGTFWHSGKTAREYDAGYGIFKAADGRLFTLGIAHEDWFWQRLCDATGLVQYRDLGTMERRSRREELRERLQEVFGQMPLSQWLEVLRAEDVPVAPIQDLHEALDDPHVAARQMIQEICNRKGEVTRQISLPIKFSQNPSQMRLPPPELGEHTDEILARVGYDDTEIQRLRQEGVV